MVGIALATVYALGMLNWSTPVLRFSAPLANALTLALLQLIPFALLVMATSADSRRARILWYVGLTPLALCAALLGSCAALQSAAIVHHGLDSSFERIEVMPLESGRLAFYRTNGGAMTSFGISVRWECRLVPGLLWVRDVWEAYPAYRASAEVLGHDRIRFTAPAYGDRRPSRSVEVVSLSTRWCPTAG